MASISPARHAIPEAPIWPMEQAIMSVFIQDVLRIMKIIVRDNFLGVFDQNVNINMCAIFKDYGIMTPLNLE